MKKLATINSNLVNLNLSVSTSDVISIGVTQIEDHLNGILISEIETINQLDEKIKKAEGNIQKEVDSTTTDSVHSMIKTLNLALKRCNQVDKKAKQNADFILTGKKGTRKIELKVLFPSDRYSGHVLHSEIVPVPTRLKKMLKKADALRVERGEHQKVYSKARQELYSIDSHQRKLTARMAQSQLSQTKEGAAMVQQISAVIKEMGFGHIVSLPKS